MGDDDQAGAGGVAAGGELKKALEGFNDVIAALRKIFQKNNGSVAGRVLEHWNRGIVGSYREPRIICLLGIKKDKI
jgi:hypothetical protein